MADAQHQLDGFLAKFSPDVEALAHALLGKLRRRLPGATAMVYDNYNALAIGFGPSEKVSRAVLSLAVYPRWVNLFFLHAAGLSDPQGLLKGEGNKVRHIRLTSPEAIDEPGVEALIAQAVAGADPPFDPGAPERLLIKSVLAKQRPRRPGASA
ncbi:MAG: hypothetical protein QOI38_2313 [Sphingomonadales bacterium]|jgi:hypothetical protein|nr:hypothetical protein [Sphingomonadales bacterium]